jgi:hypothetical protein
MLEKEKMSLREDQYLQSGGNRLHREPGTVAECNRGREILYKTGCESQTEGNASMVFCAAIEGKRVASCWEVPGLHSRDSRSLLSLAGHPMQYPDHEWLPASSSILLPPPPATWSFLCVGCRRTQWQNRSTEKK